MDGQLHASAAENWVLQVRLHMGNQRAVGQRHMPHDSRRRIVKRSKAGKLFRNPNSFRRLSPRFVEQVIYFNTFTAGVVHISLWFLYVQDDSRNSHSFE